MWLRILLALVLALGVLPSFGGTRAHAQGYYGMSCDELWYERNRIYKAAGYCFKTARAIRALGNGGCRYDNASDLPLSGRDRARIGQIARAERAKGCPR